MPRTAQVVAALFWATLLVGSVPHSGHTSNCCAPTVPPQGLLGETVALPHTLDLGLHYEYLRSAGRYEGSERIDDPENKREIWNRVTLTANYGVSRRFGVAAVVPYLWKEKSSYVASWRRRTAINTAGLGDVTLMLRFSPLVRSFVAFRELSVSFGVKFPTGATDLKESGLGLSEVLQPGTGSWDYSFGVSYYQGFDHFDCFAGLNYLLTGAHDTTDYSFEFGDLFSYLVTANFHLHPRVDVGLGLSGAYKTQNEMDNGVLEPNTARRQLWLVPALQVVVIPEVMRLQLFFEQPIYQDFEGKQLGSDFNIRLSATCSLPLSKGEEED